MSRMGPDTRIFVAGHRGLVGSAILRRLDRAGARNVLTATRDQLDLRDQAAVNYWFRANRPEYVYLVAGTVGGILANSTRPAEFLYDNMMIHATVVHASHLYEVKRLLYLGSSCIYPRESSQPMREEELLTGPLEPTNEAYAIAKILVSGPILLIIPPQLSRLCMHTSELVLLPGGRIGEPTTKFPNEQARIIVCAARTRPLCRSVQSDR